MLESANDAAVTLAEHVSGTRTAFVRLMNRRARELKLTNTHFDNPIGLDGAGNYSSAHDLARLAIDLRKHSFVRKIANRTSATLTTGYRPRTIRNRNTLLGRDASVNGAQDRPHALRRLRARGHAHARHVRSSRSCSAPRRWRRATPTRSRCCAGARTSSERIHPVTRGTVVGEPRDRVPPRRDLELVTEGVGHARGARAARRSRSHDVDVPDVVTGPVARGQRFGYREVFADGKRIAAVPIVVRRPTSPAPTCPQRTKDWFTRPHALLLAVAGAGRYGARRRAACGEARRGVARPAPSRRPHDPHRHAQHGDRQDARGAELPARPPPPHRGADRRCRAARASTSRACSRRSARR